MLFNAFVPRMDVKRQIERNGYQFYFYDNDENEDVQTMLDYMWYLMFHVRLVLSERVLIIGDSNMRNAFKNFSHYNCIKDLAIDNKSEGGRRAKHLMYLYPEIVQYRRIIVCVGNNDFNSTSDEKLLKYFTDLIEHLPYKHDILFLELLPRMDHAEYSSNDRSKFTHTKLQAFNAKMKIKLGTKFYPNKFVHPCHFREIDTCHINDLGQCKLIKTVAKIANDMLFNSHNRKI